MRLLVLHLSDIHFKAKLNPILEKVDAIAAAVRSELDLHNPTACLGIVTGDIAYSGKLAEYDQASEFFTRLKSSLACAEGLEAFEWVLVPGNHDCDFDRHTDARQTMIDTISSNPGQIATKDTSIADLCLGVQSEFFKFARRIQPEIEIRSGHDKLRYKKTLTAGAMTIRCDCYNTAWLSQHRETPSQLFYPIALLKEEKDKCDLVLSLFHHPYNWLDPDNARTFRKHVEQSSDIILTGHEHAGEFYEKRNLSGEGVQFIEGGVLQDDKPQESGFNLLVVDFGEKQWQVVQYEWAEVDQLYVPREKSEWQTFVRKRELRRHEFENDPEFAARFLLDLGATFTHPQARELTLRDLFVYPDVYDLSLEQETRQMVHSNHLRQYVLDKNRLLIIGPERIGKTTLAKTLYMDLQSHGVVPLLLNGDELKNPDENAFLQKMERDFKDQYRAALFEKYKQLPKKTKALIIDDFHRTRFNTVASRQFLDVITRIFGHVILFVNEIFELARLEAGDGKSEILLDFQHCRIREFGHALRGRLIRKWHSAGKDHTTDEEEIEYRIASTEKTVDTILGKNLIPRYPIFILTLLQVIESQTKLKTFSGSYGYIYEALITDALVSSAGKSSTLDAKYTYLSHLAYRMFTSGKNILEEDELADVGRVYFNRHKVRIGSETIRELEQASVLSRLGSRFSFKHKYLYYYFVARYLKDNLLPTSEGSKIRQKVNSLTRRLYNEDAANILVFFLYLTKDREVIGKVLSHARALFNEYEPCDMEEHVRPLIDPGHQTLRFAYVRKDKQRAKDEYLQVLDEAEDQIEKGEEEESGRQSNEEENGTSHAPSINVATKTLMIMGQILRNFPGSLRGETKLKMAYESYNLGLRTLTSVIEAIVKSRDPMRERIKKMLAEKHKIRDEKELERKANQFIFLFTLGLAYGMIKMISYSVGSEHLRETYKEVLEDEGRIPFLLIDISVKLDHFRPTPIDEVLEFNKQLRGKVFPEYLLKGLVTEYMHLYPVKERIIQRLCSKLGIEIKTVRMMESSSKR